MQFQVPQNIDMEDKLVGPLTLTQFLYLLGGGLLIYLLFHALARDYFGVFLLLAIPIGLIALALTFLKIQEQPLSHFVAAGIKYLGQPKVRLWQRRTYREPILTAPLKEEKKVAEPEKHVDKSALEQLAYKLDTAQPGKPEERKNFGRITEAFEKILKEQPKAKN